MRQSLSTLNVLRSHEYSRLCHKLFPSFWNEIKIFDAFGDWLEISCLDIETKKKMSVFSSDQSFI